MLTIRKPQIEAFQRYISEQFARQMAQHLRSMYPDKTELLSDTALAADVKTGIQKAADYGIQKPFDIQYFLETRTELGADFDSNSEMAWIGEVLSDANLTSSEKINALSDRVLFSEVS